MKTDTLLLVVGSIMQSNIINAPAAGARTWNIHQGRGGTIVHIVQSNLDGMSRYIVEWDGGQKGEYFIGELLCIGPFRSFSELEQAILDSGNNARLTLGPRGGFRGFTMEVWHQGQL